jgi:hypothetical protein
VPETDNITERLDALSTGTKRTKTGKLRQILPQIESAQAAGVTLKQICAELNASGLTLTYPEMLVLLSRIRRQKRKPQPLGPLPAIPSAATSAEKPKAFTPASAPSRSWTYNNNPDPNDPKFK